MQRPSIEGSKKLRFAAALVGLSLLTAACTTVEGTNAFTNMETFEREVLSSTAEGIGLIPRDEKEPLKSVRAPLVMPSSNNLPAPTTSKRDDLFEDSETVQLDMSNISEEDLRKIRSARVVDLRTLAGRPLTEAEQRQLTAQMIRGGLTPVNAERPLYLPPENYFTVVNNQDLVCLAQDGSLVPLTDPACPPEIRAALQEAG